MIYITTYTPNRKLNRISIEEAKELLVKGISQIKDNGTAEYLSQMSGKYIAVNCYPSVPKKGDVVLVAKLTKLNGEIIPEFSKVEIL